MTMVTDTDIAITQKPLQPKDPDYPVGRDARQTYLVFARAVINDVSLDYATLYGRFAGNDWAAIRLDEAVTRSALNAGYATQDVMKFLYQSPYAQYQVHHQQVKVKVMSEYASSVVQKVDQQMRLERMCFGRALRR